MKNIKIVSKIVNEITSFYLEKNSENFQIKIEKNPLKDGYIIFTQGFTVLSDKEIEETEKLLSIHHDAEYDEYWELMGEGDASNKLLLVARICDSIKMDYNDSILKLALKKNI